MNIEYKSPKLQLLRTDPNYTAGYDHKTIKAFRKRVQFIDSAKDERDFYAMKSLHYEKLKGKRSHQRSMRLNRQMRLILEIKKDRAGNIVVIVNIENHYKE